MKKFTKAAAVIMVLVMVAAMFAGCSRTLKGTYKAEGGLLGATGGSLTFDKDNKVSGEIFGVSIGDGEYEIEDDTITIKFSLFGVDTSKDYHFDKKGDSIWLDGTEFVKE